MRCRHTGTRCPKVPLGADGDTQALGAGDAATDCVLPAVPPVLPQTFGPKWDAATLWLEEKNYITVFIPINKKYQENV